MDTITHGLVGALIGKAFFAGDVPAGAPSWLHRPRNEERVAITCAVMGAIFPDIDVFFAFFSHDNLAFLTLHRGVTHSLLMLVVWAAGLTLLAAWIARLARWPAPPFAELFSIFGAALASHIFLDLLTSWGTMAWSPLDHTRLAWDSLFIIDLTLTATVLVPQLAAWAHREAKRSLWLAPGIWLALCVGTFATVSAVRRLDVSLSNEAAAASCILFAIFLLVPLRRRGQSRFGRVIWCRIGVALLVSYVGFATGMHYIALGKVRDYATDGHINYDNLAAIPLPPWPGRWAGLISTDTNVYRVQFNLLGGEVPKLNVYRSVTENPHVKAAIALAEVQKFLWFARFPVFIYVEREGRPVVQISDARFIGPPGPASAANTSSPLTNFAYEVVFAPDGSVISSGLANRN